MNVRPAPGAERAALRDRRLVHRLRQGDADALRQVYDRYKDDLLSVAMSVLNDRHAALDCVHDVFVQFAADPTDLHATKNLRGYLLRCVANRGKNQLKRRQLQPVSPGEEQDCAGDDDCPTHRLKSTSPSDHRPTAFVPEALPQRAGLFCSLHPGNALGDIQCG